MTNNFFTGAAAETVCATCARANVNCPVHPQQVSHCAEYRNRAVAKQAEPVALDDDMVMIPRGLVGAACSAIDKKRDAPRVLALLRDVAMSKAAQPPAQQQTQPSSNKPIAGHPLLQKLINSIELFDGQACWDYEDMYSVRDALNDAQPPAVAVQPPSLAVPDVEAIMTKAQEFASAWSLVGGRFDDGSMLADAEARKAELHDLLAAAPQPAVDVPDGWRLVPVEFLQGFNTLAHNYSLQAQAPNYYYGHERSAFSDAYARCGRDLGKLRAMLTAAQKGGGA